MFLNLIEARIRVSGAVAGFIFAIALVGLFGYVLAELPKQIVEKVKGHNMSEGEYEQTGIAKGLKIYSMIVWIILIALFVLELFGVTNFYYSIVTSVLNAID